MGLLISDQSRAAEAKNTASREWEIVSSLLFSINAIRSNPWKNQILASLFGLFSRPHPLGIFAHCGL
jgi:hypothetical protein